MRPVGLAYDSPATTRGATRADPRGLYVRFGRGGLALATRPVVLTIGREKRVENMAGSSHERGNVCPVPGSPCLREATPADAGRRRSGRPAPHSDRGRRGADPRAPA